MNTIPTIILSKRSLTHDVIELIVSNNTKVSFVPGQFLNLVVPQENNKIALRAYSIANSPQDTRDNKFRFAIKLSETGEGSKYLKSVNKGDELKWSKPVGIFHSHNESTEPVYCFATGTGIAPLLCMFEDLLESNPNLEVNVFLGFRYKVDIFWDKRLLDLEEKYINFDSNIILSKPAGYWEGLKGYVNQFATDELDYKNGKFYLCGLPQMIEDLKKILESKGVPKTNIFEEKYTNPRIKNPVE